MSDEDVIQMIADALSKCDGDYIAKMATMIVPGKTFTYIGDSLFEVESN